MAGESFQNEIPPARINIKFVKKTDGAQKEIELPLKLLVVGDFTGREPKSGDTLAQRKKININKDNFKAVMKEQDLSLRVNVANKIAGGDEELVADLKFDDLDSFHPEQVAKQVPQLRALLAARNALRELRGRVISDSEFRKALDKLAKDPSGVEAVLKDIEKVAPLPPALAQRGASDGK
jgi:type VI secretion system protein ImpB